MSVYRDPWRPENEETTPPPEPPAPEPDGPGASEPDSTPGPEPPEPPEPAPSDGPFGDGPPGYDDPSPPHPDDPGAPPEPPPPEPDRPPSGDGFRGPRDGEGLGWTTCFSGSGPGPGGWRETVLIATFTRMQIPPQIIPCTIVVGAPLRIGVGATGQRRLSEAEASGDVIAVHTRNGQRVSNLLNTGRLAGSLACRRLVELMNRAFRLPRGRERGSGKGYRARMGAVACS